MKIFRETNLEKLQPYIANDSFPIYTGFYVKVDSPDNLFDVEQSIKERYPDAGIEYPAALASLSREVLAGVKRSYDMLILFMTVPTAVILFSVRVLEGLRSHRQIGLLKAIGWRNKHVLIFILVETIVVGILGGLTASLASLLLAPYLRGIFLTGGYFGEGVVRADVKSMLYNVVSGIPDKTLLIYSPILGMSIFLMASLFTTIYYAHLSPAETLKEA
jgi:putative ABC transport system permease protein